MTPGIDSQKLSAGMFELSAESISSYVDVIIGVPTDCNLRSRCMDYCCLFMGKERKQRGCMSNIRRFGDFCYNYNPTESLDSPGLSYLLFRNKKVCGI